MLYLDCWITVFNVIKLKADKVDLLSLILNKASHGHLIQLQPPTPPPQYKIKYDTFLPAIHLTCDKYSK